MKCPNCGEEMVLKNKKWVCPGCGFETPSGVADEPQPTPATNDKCCVHCGAPLGRNKDFCYECGAEQDLVPVEEESENEAPSYSRCTRCGSPLVEGQNFCPKCGESRGGARTPSVSQNTDDTAGAGWPLAIPGLFAALFGIIFGAMGSTAPINAWLYQLGYDPAYNRLLDRLGSAQMAMFTMAGIGVALMITALFVKRVKKRVLRKTAISIFSVLTAAILVTTILCAIPIIGVHNYSYSGGSNTNQAASSSQSTTMDKASYCMLYLKITDIEVTHERNYAYVTGTVTNTGTYQVKYVRVKAVCKDYFGNVVDTDWTYAVDSVWFDPGDSKQFKMMIRDPDRRIESADVEILTD